MAAATENQGHGGYGGASSQHQFSADAAEFQPGSCSPYLRGGFFSEELGWWVPYYVGTLKSFNMRTGYGFLESTVTRDIYRRDIYIHKSQVPIPWKIGAHVEFAVSQNARGEPQATDVLWLPVSPSLVQKEKQEAPAGAASSGSTRKRHMGTLKSYSKMQGYGFITSEDVADGSTATDVYLDRSQLPPERWQFGQAVEFEVSYNHRGQPQAKNVNWDPVPKIPVDMNPGLSNAQPVGPVLSNGPPGMDLLAVGGNRAEGQQGIRNMSKIQAHLRNGDKSAAVKTAIDLSDGSEVVDYISFVLDRLGSPESVVNELTGNVPMQLLIVITRMLRKHVFAPERAAKNLAWCEVIIPLLSSSSNADGSKDLKFDNVLTAALDNLEKARTTAVNTQVFDDVIAKLGETAPRGVASDAAQGAIAP